MQELTIIENGIVLWWWALDTRAYTQFRYWIDVVGLCVKYAFEKVYNKL